MADLDQSTLAKIAGLAGSAMSLKFVQGSWPEKFAMAAGGYIASLVFSAWISAKTGLPEGGSGFLIGLFGMAICDKVWQVIQATPITQIWDGVLSWFRKNKD